MPGKSRKRSASKTATAEETMPDAKQSDAENQDTKGANSPKAAPPAEGTATASASASASGDTKADAGVYAITHATKTMKINSKSKMTAISETFKDAVSFGRIELYHAPEGAPLAKLVLSNQGNLRIGANSLERIAASVSFFETILSRAAKAPISLDELTYRSLSVQSEGMGRVDCRSLCAAVPGSTLSNYEFWVSFCLDDDMNTNVTVHSSGKWKLLTKDPMSVDNHARKIIAIIRPHLEASGTSTSMRARKKKRWTSPKAEKDSSDDAF